MPCHFQPACFKEKLTLFFPSKELCAGVESGFEAFLTQNREPATPDRLSGDAGRLCVLLSYVITAATQTLAFLGASSTDLHSLLAVRL